MVLMFNAAAASELLQNQLFFPRQQVKVIKMIIILLKIFVFGLYEMNKDRRALRASDGESESLSENIF